MTNPVVILDADGVFLDERPYWDTALRTALQLNGVDLPNPADWPRLTTIAFEELSLQRVTKQRGCNSNWDLAAVLTVALEEKETRNRFQELLQELQWRRAFLVLREAANRLWQSRGQSTQREGDPLIGFGMDREDRPFLRVREAYQDLLDPVDLEQGLNESPDRLRATFARLQAAGFGLAICTGRTRNELRVPLDAHGLCGFFVRMITADDVSAAERTCRPRRLGKPHWFPAVCAALGIGPGLEVLLSFEVPNGATVRRIYVGDGLSDFRCVEGANAIGLRLDYIHVRSGVTDQDQERDIAAAPFTIGITERLSEVPSLLLGTRNEVAS